jgi:hypothetical protein
MSPQSPLKVLRNPQRALARRPARCVVPPRTRDRASSAARRSHQLQRYARMGRGHPVGTATAAAGGTGQPRTGDRGSGSCASLVCRARSAAWSMLRGEEAGLALSV